MLGSYAKQWVLVAASAAVLMSSSFAAHADDADTKRRTNIHAYPVNAQDY